MAEPRFEWDEKKRRSNKKKHGVSFEEALTGFSDENALLVADPDHSNEEDRFSLLGLSAQLRMLVVCHCYWERAEIIRLISARKATRVEREQYNKRWKK